MVKVVHSTFNRHQYIENFLNWFLEFERIVLLYALCGMLEDELGAYKLKDIFPF